MNPHFQSPVGSTPRLCRGQEWDSNHGIQPHCTLTVSVCATQGPREGNVARAKQEQRRDAVRIRSQGSVPYRESGCLAEEGAGPRTGPHHSLGAPGQEHREGREMSMHFPGSRVPDSSHILLDKDTTQPANQDHDCRQQG